MGASQYYKLMVVVRVHFRVQKYMILIPYKVIYNNYAYTHWCDQSAPTR